MIYYILKVLKRFTNFSFYNIKFTHQQNDQMNLFLQIIQSSVLPTLHTQQQRKTTAQACQVPLDPPNPSTILKTVKKKQSRSHYSRNWSTTQNRKYLQFLQNNRALFSLTFEEKKKIKLNVLMSRMVKTRTPIQCHSHHQSMLHKLGTIDDILMNYSSPAEVVAVGKCSISRVQDPVEQSLTDTVIKQEREMQTIFEDISISHQYFELGYFSDTINQRFSYVADEQYNDYWQYQ